MSFSVSFKCAAGPEVVKCTGKVCRGQRGFADAAFAGKKQKARRLVEKFELRHWPDLGRVSNSHRSNWILQWSAPEESLPSVRVRRDSDSARPGRLHRRPG